MKLLCKSGNLVYGFVFLAPFILFLIPLLEGKVIFWGTAGLQFIPWRTYGYALLSEGVFPFWNPLNGMGAPLFANYQTAFLYPLSWILYPFYLAGGAPALAWAYTLLVAVHLGIAGIGTALLLREMGVNTRGQVIAALAFSFCGYFVARASFFSMIWAGVWLPWLIWAIERLIKSEKFSQQWQWMIGLALIAANQLLAGHAQLTFYSFVFAGSWIVFRVAKISLWKTKLKIVTLLALGMVLAFLIASVQLIPTLEYLLQSQRSDAVDYEYAMNYSLWPWRLLGFLLPDLFGNPGRGNYWGFGAYWEDALYIGLLPILLSLHSLNSLFSRKPVADFDYEKRRMVKFLWMIIIFAIVLSLGKNTPVFPWLYRHVPGFDMFQAPTRWMLLAVFSLALLAGLGAHSWGYPTAAGIKRLRLLAAASVAVGIGAMVAGIVLPQIEQTFIRSFLTFGVLLFLISILALFTPGEGEFNHKRRKLWEGFAVGIMVVDLWVAGAYSNPFMEASFFNSSASVSKPLENHARIYIPSTVENRLKFEKYLLFSDFNANSNWDEIKLLPLPNMNLLLGVPMVNNFDPLVTNRYNQWMDWLNNLVPVESQNYLEKIGVGSVVQLGNHLDWHVIPLQPQSRIMWRACQRVAGKDENVLKSMVLQQMEFSGGEECIIVEAEDQCKIASDQIGANTTIEVLRDEVNLIEVAVRTNSTGWLRFADSWYPGWDATIDGQSASVERVDYLFKGVCVPAGNHIITFRYLPTAFPLVLWASLGTLIFCLITVVMAIKFR